MAVGVRFYGRGTRRPGGGFTDDPDFPKTQPGGTQPVRPAQGSIYTETLPGGTQMQYQQSPYGSMPIPYQGISEIVSLLAPTGPTAPGTGGPIIPWPGLTSSGGGTDSDAATLAFNIRKYEDEQRRNQFGAAQSSQMLQDMLANLGNRFGGLSDIISTTGKENQAFIQQQYEKALAELSGRQAAGEKLQKEGFGSARTALEKMKPTAFEAPALALPAAATNQLQQYLSARGVPQEAINAEITKVNQASQDAQTNYTGLLGTLSAIEKNAAQSRVVETNLAEAVAKAQLATIYGGATSALEQQKLKSLNDLFNQLQSQRFQLEQSRIAREDALNDALAKLAQSGYPIRGASEPTGGGSGSQNDGTKQPQTSQPATPAEALAALNALAPTDVNAPAPMMLPNIPAPQVIEQLIALAQQAPQYTGGGAGMGVAPGLEAVMMANGGVVTKPTLAIIGEDGPEAVIPLKKALAAKKVMKQAKKIVKKGK